MKRVQKELVEVALTGFAMPYAGAQMILDKDARKAPIGCVFLQEQSEKPTELVSYCSRLVTCPEREYDTTSRECLSIVWAVLLPRLYLESTRYTITTSHDSLNWISILSDASGRLARCRLPLFKLDFYFVNRAGVKHQVAYALLILRTDGDKKTHLDDDLSVCNV